MTKEEIVSYYNGCGRNTDDLQNKLEETCTQGYERSYDGSLGVYHFNTFTVIAGCGCFYFTKGF